MPEVLWASIEEIPDLSHLEKLWLDLEARGEASFFQSWGWIGCWLRALPGDFEPRVLMVRAGDTVVGLGIVIGRRRSRHGFVRSRGLSLNETGDPHHDQLTMEYNGFLVDEAVREEAEKRIFDLLIEENRDWDELYLSGLTPETWAGYAPAVAGRRVGVWMEDTKPSDYVDLEAVRQGDGDYLAILSRNTRQQIRRAMRRYESSGPLCLEAASSLDEAFGYFDELKVLHQKYWNSRGNVGSFANAFFEKFHRSLIETLFESGAIQLLRISAGGEAFGYLYNFLKDGRIYAYQSGFRYDDDRRLKPGLVSHYLAIDFNLAQDHRVYDFMAGESQHKKSLGTHSVDMYWVVLQRNRLVFRLEHLLRGIKAGVREKIKNTR